MGDKSHIKDRTLIVDSQHLTGQNANDLTVQLDEELRDVIGVRLIYAGLPCTFHNISRELDNHYFSVNDGSGYKYVTLPDGFYDVASFSREFQNQLEIGGFGKYGIAFDVQESSGRIEITFRKRSGKKLQFLVRDNIADLLGFNLRKGGRIELPRTGSKVSLEVGDKPINFKPFQNILIHCDVTDNSSVLYNGKKSNVLVRVPVKKCDFGETMVYYLTGLRDRECDQSFNKIRLWVTDENDKPIDFNGADIQYELLFRFQDFR